MAAGADCRASARPPERLGRNERSSHGEGMPTNGRRRGPALFEREITASEGRARVRGVLVMAGGRSTAVTRRFLAGEPFRRGSGIGGTTKDMCLPIWGRHGAAPSRLREGKPFSLTFPTYVPKNSPEPGFQPDVALMRAEFRPCKSRTRDEHE